MREIELVGVPFDGYGRPGNQARAAAALRSAGIADVFAGHRVVGGDDLDLPAPDPRRGADTSLLNEAALVAMSEQLHQRVGGAVAAGRFPVLLGADCTTLLGTVGGLRDARGPDGFGLLFVDGHEDTMPLDVSEDGEAANTEIGLLLGLTGGLLRGPLADRRGTLPHPALAVLGPRDGGWRRQFNVGSLRDHGIWLRDAEEVAADPSATAAAALDHLRQHADHWWLHLDVDVLDPSGFAAQGIPGFEDEPGGLGLAQLGELLVTAVAAGGCLGWSLAIYDPDQDPDGLDADQLVRLVGEVAAALR